MLLKSRSLEFKCSEERPGRPDFGIDRLEASEYCYHEQFMESFSSATYSKWDDDRVWSSQELKPDIDTRAIRAT